MRVWGRVSTPCHQGARRAKALAPAPGAPLQMSLSPQRWERGPCRGTSGSLALQRTTRRLCLRTTEQLAAAIVPRT